MRGGRWEGGDVHVLLTLLVFRSPFSSSIANCSTAPPAIREALPTTFGKEGHLHWSDSCSDGNLG